MRSAVWEGGGVLSYANCHLLEKYGHIYEFCSSMVVRVYINPLKPELNPICYLLALLGAHHFLPVSRIRVKLLTLSY